MSKKSSKTRDPKAKKTTDASDVELEEKQLDDVVGGAAFAKYDGIDGESFIDKATTLVSTTTIKPRSR